MDTRRTVQIGRSSIGQNQPVYVIAEAGVNHNGDLPTAMRLVEAAAEAGADAVKFQFFSADRLVSESAPTCTYQSTHTTGALDQRTLLRKLELPADRFVALKARAHELGLDFLATPFGISEVHALVELGVPAIKIASPDIVNLPLLIAAAETGLPLIVSTGASLLDEVESAVRLLQSRGAGERLVLLHCVSSYPTQPANARLRCIRTLASRFDLPVGFSDHTDDADFSGLAVAAGATLLEKHLTLDRGADGPDHFFSLTPDDFARYASGARKASASLGSGRIECSPEEFEVRKLSRGSIVATTAIPAGRAIHAEQLAVRRPSGGIEPQCWFDVVGMEAATDIPAGAMLNWELLRPALTPAEAAAT